MSLLTGTPMTAAEVARELGLTHANASYHLRNLHSAGMILLAGEEKIRGGVAKRYRYESTRDSAPETADQRRSLFVALGNELVRRSARGQFERHEQGIQRGEQGIQRGEQGIQRGEQEIRSLLGDGDFWIDPDKWQEIMGRVAAAIHDLHAAAQPPRTAGTVRTSTTVAMFELDSPDLPEGPAR